jgi:DNA-binding CsgD family transcriptional regulator
MTVSKRTRSKQEVPRISKDPRVAAEFGLVLIDPSLKIIAIDGGAAAILKYPAQTSVKGESAHTLPKEILETLRSRQPTDLSPLTTAFRIRNREYICRAYLMESHAEFLPGSIVALVLDRHSSASDSVDEVAAVYHLTPREKQALRGLSTGLTSNEVAEQMDISPNTLKSFLRLIMIKMGATSRAGIVARILQNRPPLSIVPVEVDAGTTES